MKSNHRRGNIFAPRGLFSAVIMLTAVLICQAFGKAPPGHAQEDLMRDPYEKIDIKKQEAPQTRNAKELLEYAAWLEPDNPEKALAQYRGLVDKYPESAELKAAYLGQARCLLSLGRPGEAFKAAEASFPKKLPTAEMLAERCALELEIAQKLAKLGNRPVAEAALPEGKNETGTAAASRVFAAILYNDPHGKYVPDALLGLGDAQFAMGNILEAKRAYLALVKDYEKHPLANTARIRGAKCLILEKEHGKVSPDRLTEAERLLQRVGPPAALAPPLAAEAAAANRLLDNGQAEEKMQQAEFYLQRGGGERRKAGIYLLERIVQLHPDTDVAKVARQRLGELGK